MTNGSARIAAAIIAAGVLMSFSADAQQGGVRAFFTGNQLWVYCGNPTYEAFCNGYAAGVADAVAAIDPRMKLPCFPANVTVQQVADVARQYLEQHPEKRQYTAFSEVTAALDQAFPCSP